MPGGGQAGHQGRLSEVYRNAVELNGGSLVSAGGFVTTVGLLGGLATTYWGYVTGLTLQPETAAQYLLKILVWMLVWALFFIGIYFEMFSPSETPIYLDRLQRKVYYVHQGKRKRFLLFGPTSVEARAADWSLVDCELHALMGGGANSVRRTYHLLFLVRASKADPTIVDSFVLPNVEFPGAMWEYIRGFMELGMPPLKAEEVPPTKGAKGIKGFDMVEALRQRRIDYWRDWKEFPWTQFWQHLVLPLFIAYFIVNRFVVWTAQTVIWPNDILDALGAPVTAADLDADVLHALRAAAPSSGRASTSPEAL